MSPPHLPTHKKTVVATIESWSTTASIIKDQVTHSSDCLKRNLSNRLKYHRIDTSVNNTESPQLETIVTLNIIVFRPCR